MRVHTSNTYNYKYKYFIVALVILAGVVYSLPMLYQNLPAVQIATTKQISAQEEKELTTKLATLLQQNNIAYHSIVKSPNGFEIAFKDTTDQITAKDILTNHFAAKGNSSYTIALNLTSTLPSWLKSVGAKPLTLGLDLRGGIHFLLEVDLNVAINQRLSSYISTIKKLLRKNKLRYTSVTLLDKQQLIAITLSSASVAEVKSLLNQDFPDLEVKPNNLDQADKLVTIGFTPVKIKQIQSYIVAQNLTTLRNRVNELGIAEPIVQRQGKRHIVVQLPGVQDATAAKKILGATANLEFRLEAEDRYSGQKFTFRSSNADAYLSREIIITGVNVIDANAGFDENSRPQVAIKLDSKGGRSMTRATNKAIQKRMAVLFIEHKTEDSINIEGKKTRYVEKKIISLATIQEVLGNQFVITGLDSQAESSALALLLRAGSLAAPIYIVQEMNIGPSLGWKNIETSMNAIIIGFILVLLFMAVYYHVFGLIANLALILNIVLVTSCMALLGATLTLPGMAGIVLTIGMAVDANVLIFSRIKEELKNGMSNFAAINSGYDKAFITILDANVTTLLVAIILFSIGTGAVKGFAITLSLGIVTSMFSAIIFTRCCVNLIYKNKSEQSKLAIGKY